MPETWYGLVSEHQTMAASCVAHFQLRHPVADRAIEPEDLLSEAYVALCEAARHWRPEAGPFRVYARLCIHRRLLELRQQSGDVPIRLESEESESAPLQEALTARERLPDEQVIDRELIHALRRALASLPPKVSGILRERLMGASQTEIARRHHCRKSSIAAVERAAFRNALPELAPWLDGEPVLG